MKCLIFYPLLAAQKELLEGRGLGHVGTFDQGIPCKATEYQAPWSWLNLTKPSQSSRDFPRIGGTVCSKPSNFWCSEALFWGPKNWGHPIYGQPSGQTIFSTNPLPACRFRGALEAQWSERWEMGLGAAAAWRRQVAKMVINCLHCRRHHQQKTTTISTSSTSTPTATATKSQFECLGRASSRLHYWLLNWVGLFNRIYIYIYWPCVELLQIWCLFKHPRNTSLG